MRVATRRMRSMWRVFDGAYRPKIQRRYVRELRTVASALGSVRDLDVQLEELDAWAATPEAARGSGDTTPAAALRPLRDELVARRDDARRDLIDLLDSRRYQDFVATKHGMAEALRTLTLPSEGYGDEPKSEAETIVVRGAREHNLQVDYLEIPKRSLVVFTG